MQRLETWEVSTIHCLFTQRSAEAPLLDNSVKMKYPAWSQEGMTCLFERNGGCHLVKLQEPSE